MQIAGVPGNVSATAATAAFRLSIVSCVAQESAGFRTYMSSFDRSWTALTSLPWSGVPTEMEPALLRLSTSMAPGSLANREPVLWSCDGIVGRAEPSSTAKTGAGEESTLEITKRMLQL